MSKENFERKLFYKNNVYYFLRIYVNINCKKNLYSKFKYQKFDVYRFLQQNQFKTFVCIIYILSMKRAYKQSYYTIIRKEVSFISSSSFF